MQCVGATTLNEYRKYIEKDAALERRFQTVKVEAPTVEEAILILKGLRPKYEAHHKAKLTDEALEAAVKLSERYITGRFLPDKAIDVMDEAGARARIDAMTRPPDVKDIEKEIEEIRVEKEARDQGPGFRKSRRAARQGKAGEGKTRTHSRPNGAKQREEKEVHRDRGRHDARRLESGPAFRCRRMEQKETQKLLAMEAELKQRGHRPGRSRHRDQQGAAPFARRSERSAPPDRLVRLPRTDRRRQDLPRADARRIHVRRFRCADPDRHVGVHGEVHRLAPDRFASGLCRLRRRRPAYRSGPAPAVLGGAFRRNRKSAPGRDAPAPADSGRRQTHRLVRPQDRFPEHDHHHDLERRRGTDQEVRRRWASARRQRRAGLRDDAGQDPGGNEARL